MAIAIGARDEIFVLDQVNSRIVQGDKVFPTGMRGARDLAIGPRGDMAVLEPKRVAWFGPDGTLRKAIAAPDLATGVTVEPSGIWVEIEHAWNVRVAGPDGQEAAPGEKRDGKASRDGVWLLSAGIAEQAAGTAWVRALDAKTGEFRWQKRYAFPAPILRLALLDSLADGRIAFAAHVAREITPGRFADESMQVLCLDRDGAVRNALTFPPPEGPEEAMRELAAGLDGRIVYLLRNRTGLRILSGNCN